MAIFEVYVPEKTASAEQIANARFLKDRVSVFALLVPAIWLLWHRLWFAFAAYLIFTLALAGIASSDYAPAAMAFSFLPGVYIFLEGSNLIADKWESEGFQLVDLVEADNQESAELRWIANQKSGQKAGVGLSRSSMSGHPPTEPVAPRPHQNEDRPEFGLFAEETP